MRAFKLIYQKHFFNTHTMEKIKTQNTQKQTILKHLKKKKTITTFECFELYWFTDLRGIIRDLRNEGHNIPPVEWKKNPQTGSRYGVYRLVK